MVRSLLVITIEVVREWFKNSSINISTCIHSFTCHCHPLPTAFNQYIMIATLLSQSLSTHSPFMAHIHQPLPANMWIVTPRLPAITTWPRVAQCFGTSWAHCAAQWRIPSSPWFPCGGLGPLGPWFYTKGWHKKAFVAGLYAILPLRNKSKYHCSPPRGCSVEEERPTNTLCNAYGAFWNLWKVFASTTQHRKWFRDEKRNWVNQGVVP